MRVRCATSIDINKAKLFLIGGYTWNGIGAILHSSTTEVPMTILHTALQFPLVTTIIVGYFVCLGQAIWEEWK